MAPQRAVCDNLDAALCPAPITRSVHAFRCVTPISKKISFKELPSVEANLKIAGKRLTVEKVELWLIELRVVYRCDAPRESIIHGEGDLLEEVRIREHWMCNEVLCTVDKDS